MPPVPNDEAVAVRSSSGASPGPHVKSAGEAPGLLPHARRHVCLQHVLLVPQDRVDVELGGAIAPFAEARRQDLKLPMGKRLGLDAVCRRELEPELDAGVQGPPGGRRHHVGFERFHRLLNVLRGRRLKGRLE